MKRAKTYPSLTRPLMALIRDVATRVPELSHVKAERVLVVAGEARRASHASIRPLSFPGTHTRISRDGTREKPRVRVSGHTLSYVITLRPIWFRASTAEQRVGTVLHELFHCSRRFDGTLHPGRRHAAMGPRFGQKLRPLVRAYLNSAPASVVAPFRRAGLVRVRMWLEKPPASLSASSKGRRLYTEDQLFVGLVRMLSAAAEGPLRGP